MVRACYTSRPPTSAPQARRVWDYAEQYCASPRRPLIELCYSPNLHSDGPGWYWEIKMLPEDSLHWKFSRECLTSSSLSRNLPW